jgi:asparagine synthase (glutamine-hydrolysing)
MFAFAIWDEPQQRLFLARDRLGKKPLHFHFSDDGEISFASEVQALLSDPDIGREIDLEAIDGYLSHGYVPGGRSALGGIRKLPPATTLTWGPGEPEPEPER